MGSIYIQEKFDSSVPVELKITHEVLGLISDMSTFETLDIQLKEVLNYFEALEEDLMPKILDEDG